ncbi:amidase [Pseudomonas sp. 58 R 3]|nr:amidase [Pseudomonas sp. 58 R 3]
MRGSRYASVRELGEQMARPGGLTSVDLSIFCKNVFGHWTLNCALPSGKNEDGLPTGAYFFGTRWAERTLLAIAYGYEQAAQADVKPEF